jgi:predicted nucleic acid-binding protein
VIVLDASVLIAFMDADDQFHGPARTALEAALGRPLRASALTLAEVLVRPTRIGVLPVAKRALAAIGVDPVPIGRDGPERLAELRVRTGLKLPDCCVLLAGQDVRAEAVLSFDERLRQAAHDAGFAATA